MFKTIALVSALALSTSLSFAADDVVHAVDGTVTKIDTTTKTIAVKTADGTEHTFHYLGDVTVHGSKDAAKGTVNGVKEGSKVAVHYTVEGSKETAHEFDNIGDDGLKATDGTVTHVDRGAKTIAVKTADGTVDTFHFSEDAAKDTGKDIGKGTEKSAKVTVYYTEKAGVKTAHFVKEVF
jgi:VCBS repeat-containing protein